MNDLIVHYFVFQARQVVEREFSSLLACITERTQDGSEFIAQQHTSTHLA